MADTAPTIDDRFDSTALSWRCWIALGLAAAGTVCAMRSRPEGPGWADVAGISLAIAGLILIASAIARTPRNIPVLLVGVGTALLAIAATYNGWDSAQLLFMVMAGVAVSAIVVVLMPSPARKAVASGLAVFHFLGVLSAITSPPPQSWLSNWAWVTLFRHHLVFCYTNNAYQFYSPEPGPASLLWFCVEMQDGSKTWYKMPRKPETHLDPLCVEFFRRLSMTEAVNQNMTIQSIGPDVLRDRLSLINQIPFHPEIPQAAQYRPPQPHVRRTFGSYVRHVVSTYGGAEQVRAVRVYRVLHRMLDARQFANGDNPFAEATYLPYFMGEYDAKGGLINPEDPLLFWLIPVVRKPPTVTPMTRPGMEPVDNYLLRHAGIDPFEERYGAAP
jgi:hypothetical protein